MEMGRYTCKTSIHCNSTADSRALLDRESVRERWTRDDYSQLQPEAPDFISPLMYVAIFMNASCGARETKLQGTSSVGSLSAMSSVTNEKEAEDST